MPGQFLERSTLVDLGEFCLEGLWHRGNLAPALLILSPHPDFGGGSMDAPLSLELAWAATRHKHATLRFNWRGVGASLGNVGGLETSLVDAQFALKLLQEDVPGFPIALAGCFFGAQVAMELALQMPSLVGLFLIAPTLTLSDVAILKKIQMPIRVIFSGGGTPPDEALIQALEAQGIGVDVIEEADENFTEGLFQTGTLVANHLDRLGGAQRDAGGTDLFREDSLNQRNPFEL